MDAAFGTTCPVLPAPGESRLREAIEQRYRCCREEVTVGGTCFSVLRVADPNVLLDAIDPATFADDERLPYWSELWASSILLAEWCLAFPGLRGKRVLELGCGLGLAGIAAARAGAVVVLSDYEDDALLFARYNSLHNSPGVDIEMLRLDWRRPRLGRRFDVLLGADILYERRHFRPLLEALGELLAPGGVAALSDPDRSTGNAFFDLAEKEGYTLRRRSARVAHHGRDVQVNCCELRSTSAEQKEETR
jgi:predicted nicotinamide N-methyase